jgi:hypothetical protein
LFLGRSFVFSGPLLGVDMLLVQALATVVVAAVQMAAAEP